MHYMDCVRTCLLALLPFLACSVPYVFPDSLLRNSPSPLRAIVSWREVGSRRLHVHTARVRNGHVFTCFDIFGARSALS